MVIYKGKKPNIQENDNTPLENTPGNPRSQLWKESLYSLLVKVWGCVPKVCWNNLRKNKKNTKKVKGVQQNGSFGRSFPASFIRDLEWSPKWRSRIKPLKRSPIKTTQEGHWEEPGSLNFQIFIFDAELAFRFHWIDPSPNNPCGWYIYLHALLIVVFHAGNYTSLLNPMELIHVVS